MEVSTIDNKNDNSYQLARLLLKLLTLFKPKKHEQKLTPVEHMVIMCIHRCIEQKGEPTPTFICNELGLSKSNLTNILNKLESNGYISRKISVDNRRNVIVELTEKSSDIHRKFHQSMDRAMVELTECLGKEDSDKLLDILNKIYQYKEEKERK